MAEYATEQKKMLSDFLKDHAECAFSIDGLIEGMRACYGDRVPGTSTVYRLMTKLVEEGSVKRFVKGHSRQFLYQAVLDEHCRSHLHLRCVGCGKLVHLDERVSHSVLDAIRKSNDFSVNEEETMLFGECAHCAARKS